ncbi:MAG TPA: methyl-accepting chemotaxis protein [Dongiaceae bacterium]|nr:methyl-accepting chemotaxis protein [Dongiaceae bacterium]
MLSGLVSHISHWSLAKAGRFLIICFIVGMAGFALMSRQLLDGVKVNGATYQKIVLVKDLVADILPPPEYIIESHLSVLQMMATRNKVKQQAWMDNLDRVEKEFRARHEFWLQDKILKPELKQQITEAVYKPAEDYYRVLHDEFLPPMQKGQLSDAKIAFNKLDELYNQHRKAVDTLVADSLAEQAAIEQQTRAAVEHFESLMLSILVVSIVLVSGIVMVILQGLRRRFGGEPVQVEQVLQKVTAGDFSGRGLQPVQASEQSLLGQAVVMRNHLRQLLGSFADMAVELDRSAGGMQKDAHRGEQDAQVQQDDARTMAAAIEELSVSIDQLSRNSSQQLVLAQSATRESGAGRQMVQQCGQVLQRLCAFVQKLAENVQRLNDNSKRIESITLTIKDVAEQTNLLALNAAIEAARAGESGRGFAVVADEVRSLSARTRQSTHEIDNIVARIRDEVNLIVGAVDEGVRLSNQGMQSMEQASQSIDHLQQGAQELEAHSQTVAAALAQQNQATQTLARDVSDIANRAQQQAAQARTATASAQQLADMANSMTGQLDRFSLR